MDNGFYHPLQYKSPTVTGLLGIKIAMLSMVRPMRVLPALCHVNGT